MGSHPGDLAVPRAGGQAGVAMLALCAWPAPMGCAMLGRCRRSAIAGLQLCAVGQSVTVYVCIPAELPNTA